MDRTLMAGLLTRKELATLPTGSPDKIEAPKHRLSSARDSKSATISVKWGYEVHSITLAPRNWAAVKAGKPHQQRGSGYRYEGQFFWDYWAFGGGLNGSLDVAYGEEGAEGFRGRLGDARIEEHRESNRHRHKQKLKRDAKP